MSSSSSSSRSSSSSSSSSGGGGGEKSSVAELTPGGGVFFQGGYLLRVNLPGEVNFSWRVAPQGGYPLGVLQRSREEREKISHLNNFC